MFSGYCVPMDKVLQMAKRFSSGHFHQSDACAALQTMRELDLISEDEAQALKMKNMRELEKGGPGKRIGA